MEKEELTNEEWELIKDLIEEDISALRGCREQRIQKEYYEDLKGILKKVEARLNQ